MGKTFGYKETNEPLSLIVSAINPDKNDNALVVCGSGDVPFAFLEFVGGITAIDIRAAQIAYTRERLARLKSGGFKYFLHPNRSEHIDVNSRPFENLEREEYFLERDRLEKIRSRADTLRLAVGDIFDRSDVGDYSVVYLSNLIGSSNLAIDFQGFVDECTRGTRIYVADHREVVERISEMPRSLEVEELILPEARGIVQDLSPALYKKAR